MNDKQRIEYANWEYSNLELGDPITIKGKGVVGTVSQVNDKSTGEQSFIITDIYVPPTAPIEDRAKVKDVSVLYQGSSFSLSSDAAKDWLLNDIPTALQVINSSGPTAMPQLQSSVDTLQKTLKAYPNAKITVYGHSLGSMNGQYALANLTQNELSRVEGFLYEGPNIYSVLSPTQKKIADQLTSSHRVLNFVDQKDLVTIGYGEKRL